MPSTTTSTAALGTTVARRPADTRLRAFAIARPELALLLGAAAVLYLWGLSGNGLANE